MVGRSPTLSASHSNIPTPITASPRYSSDEVRPNAESESVEEGVVRQSLANNAAASSSPKTHDVNESSGATSPVEGNTLDAPSLPQDHFIPPNGDPKELTKLKSTSPSTTSPTSLAQYQDLVEQLRLRCDIAEQQKEDDANEYLEQIDNLQAKLGFMAQEASAEAKRLTTARQVDESQGRLAQKEEQIALLIEEGIKLSQNEMKLRSTIKRMRADLGENEKAKQNTARVETDLRTEVAKLRGRAKELETTEREYAKSTEALNTMQIEVNRLGIEAKAKDLYIQGLKQQISKGDSTGTAEEVEKWKRLYDAERVNTASLQDDLTNSKLERDLQGGRHKVLLKEAQTKLDQEVGLRKINELDLKRELQVRSFLKRSDCSCVDFLTMQAMESRLETYRTRAEEISSEGNTDVQAKLIRQVETLQTSYSVASENWRGIENSLLSRIAVLEKEQAESLKKENDLRRKTREVAGRCRELEVQLGREASKTQELEDSLSHKNADLSALHGTLLRAEADLDSARSELMTTKASFEACNEGRGRKGSPGPASLVFDNESPLPVSTFEEDAAKSHRLSESPGLGFSTIGATVPERTVSRRTSAHPAQFSASYRQDSATYFTQPTGREALSPIPAVRTESQENMFDGVATPITPERTINDMLSTSTAAAGPSVQLVERMSAAVRRLETEKAALKDEIDRLSSQRDEARNQVIVLMQETEAKQAAQARNESLTAEIQELKLRLHTTLEMLGEKSELVEELRADIVDMKAIYRSTIEDTVK